MSEAVPVSGYDAWSPSFETLVLPKAASTSFVTRVMLPLPLGLIWQVNFAGL